MRRVGIVGSMVWDLIYGRDPAVAPAQEWGGIAYALSGLDAAVAEDWEIVPLIKVGRDLATEARGFLSGLRHLTPAARCVEVPTPNNRVTLRYQSAERRCERMSGGVPGWTWAELGPMVRDLDALYVNFISGWEMCLGTAQALRQGFPGPLYADLHSLFLGMHQDGIRRLQPLADPGAWFGCFDFVQVNEEEMQQLSPDPLALSAAALGAGVSLLTVTLGPRGAAYVAAPGFGRLADLARGRSGAGGPVRTARVPAEPVAGRRSHRLRRRLRSGPVRPAPGWRSGGERHRYGQPAGGTERGLPRGGRAGAPPARGAGERMTRVVEVPAYFDDRSFDQFAQALALGAEDSQRILVDAHAAQWASPYGLVGMLTAAQAIQEARGEKPLFTVPDTDEVRRYWAKAGFFRYAAELFEIHGKVPRVQPDEQSDVLLDVTPVRAAEDVHHVVGKIQEGAARILSGELKLEAKATMGFAMALSEACQNIVEHAGTSGWVAVHAYTFRRRLGGRRVVVIAVSDAGVGFRRSLEAVQAKRLGDRWGDGAALEAGLIQGVSRFRDPGRGQGLSGHQALPGAVERQGVHPERHRPPVDRPPWDDDVPLAEHLPYFPGAQVQIVIPAQQDQTTR